MFCSLPLDGEPRLIDDLLGIFDVGACQPGDDGQFHVEGLVGFDDAVGDDGAVDDAAKHVDQDPFDLGVLADYPESLTHLMLLNATADVTAKHKEKV